METALDQRKSSRTHLTWPVSVWMPQANRFVNGTSENISKSGALLRLPLTTPVRFGQIVELNFPRTSKLAEEKGQFARIKTGKVVRIERQGILTDAKIGVAIQFE